MFFMQSPLSLPIKLTLCADIKKPASAGFHFFVIGIVDRLIIFQVVLYAHMVIIRA